MAQRLEVRVSDDLAKDLEDLAAASETTRSEIFRRAMTLYALARAEKEGGGQVLLRSAEGEREVIAF